MNGRKTPGFGHRPTRSQQLGRNLNANIRNISMDGDAQRRSNPSALAALRSTAMISSKPVLPAELIATILDYLPPADMIRFARVNRRLQEMVYDDSRWIQKLRAIGVWDEREARKTFEDSMKKKAEAQRQKEAKTGIGVSSLVDGDRGTMLFDAGLEETKYRQSLDQQQQSTPRRKQTLADGFDELTISPSSTNVVHKAWDHRVALVVLDQVQSVRGHAREEFGRIHAALGPFYSDIAKSNRHSDPLVFRTFRDPEQQAQVLANLKRYSQCDDAVGWSQREQKLDSLMGVFANAVLREFEQGYVAHDVDGRMSRYAHVLCALDGGNAVVDSFISRHPLMVRSLRLGNPMDCLDAVATGHVDLNPSRNFFEKLANLLIEQADVIDRVFPPTVDVLTSFFSQICEDILSEYLTVFFDEAHRTHQETYIKAVSGTFVQSLRLVTSLKTTKASPPDFRERAKAMVVQCFEKHVDLYLGEELTSFKARAESEVAQWEKQMSEQEASTESFLMSNINRQAAKRDFLSSFKKVVMMPVNVFPAFGPRPNAPAKVPGAAHLDGEWPSRTASPALGLPGDRPATPVAEPPTTELAAKTAIINSRLEGIKSLFSLEVALNLTHYAKASIERTAALVQMGGEEGRAAREQCGLIFIHLLTIIGDRHIRVGFDKAVSHLGDYNPRQVREFRAQHLATVSGDNATDMTGQVVGVEPLVTFLELVNVGDLIQQMIDVFYSQELVATKLTERDDFLDPVQKEKKRFEQMLDERVAAGLNKGIDVLVDEIEYICATTQLPTDFNPTAAPVDGRKGLGPGIIDIGPSSTAVAIVNTVNGHTSMLVGSTDKNMLDVFTQEVGVRLFGALCKHFKRQRISVDGAIKLISDINHYHTFITTLRQKPLLPYFTALRELGQIYLVCVDPPANLFAAGNGKRGSGIFSGKTATSMQAKELATIIADTQRYRGIFAVEEVYEFAERRADWYLIKRDVERAMYGIGCSLM